MLLVKAKLIDGRFRIVDSFTEKVVYKKNGTAWDGGGHVGITTAIQQAAAINSGDETDLTLPKGERGADGKSGKDSVGLRWRGDYNPTSIYRKFDIVKFKGDVWIWIADQDGNAPVTKSQFWDLVVPKGEKGEQGDSGSGRQGSPGPQGPPGASGAASLSKTAGEAISALRAVYLLNGSAFKADKDNFYAASAVIGITTSAANTGETVEIATDSELSDNGWNWSEVGSAMIYLGDDGSLTQSAPTSGSLVVIGRVISSTSIEIQIGQPIALA